MTTETPPEIFSRDPYRLTDDNFADIECVRSMGGVGWVELPDGLRAVMVTDAAAIRQVVLHTDVSRDGAAHWPDLATQPADSATLPWVTSAGAFSAHGSEHRRLKKLMTAAFTKRQVDRLKPAIEEIVAGVLDDITVDNPADLRDAFALYGWDPVDLVASFCFPVPITVIGRMLGVDEDLFPALRSGADALFDTSLSPQELGARFMGLVGAIQELVARKRARPDESLTSRLIEANQDGDTYTAAELAETVRILIVGGYETTAHLLAQCIVLLLTHPQHLDAVLALEPGSPKAQEAWLAVIDETMRVRSTSNAVPMRFAVRDLVIDGFAIAQGTPVLVAFAGAGRDPRIHDRPHVFDPNRATKDHYGFGLGVHRCPGSELARLEALVALPMLFGRYRLALVEDVADIPPNPGFITNGYQRLLVTLDPPRPH